MKHTKKYPPNFRPSGKATHTENETLCLELLQTMPLQLITEARQYREIESGHLALFRAGFALYEWARPT